MSDAREQRGQDIAKVAVLARNADGTWLVPSMSGNGRYIVNPAAATCTCPNFETRGCKCKHQYAVEFYARRETTTHADGSVTVTETVEIKATKKKTYKQDWPNYNAAQTNEKHEFLELLHDLCKDVPTPAQTGKGQRRLPMSDAVFAVTFKIYSTISARRFMCDLSDAQDRGYISEVPHFNSIFNYLENPELTPILENLIAVSATPLKSVETEFAVDSSGFTSSRFLRWFDHKYGTVQVQHDWVKAHIACGVKTNVVTAVEIHGRDDNDSPLLPALVNSTAEKFNVKEVSADKGYSSGENHNAIVKIGATPFIAFKEGATGGIGGTFEKMFHYFNFRRDDFLKHYHKRSNVESTFSMIKAKFRDHVRSKTPVAMKNEVLCKILCHNLCCVISAMYELEIEPLFLHNGKTTCTTGAEN